VEADRQNYDTNLFYSANILLGFCSELRAYFKRESISYTWYICFIVQYLSQVMMNSDDIHFTYKSIRSTPYLITALPVG